MRKLESTQSTQSFLALVP
uniref:Uncharacterized protein n=1 Tax=Lepeophtheirus salmonis TaxID=72036 RepID=A0A0K2U9S2_LEPSM